jgi:hypothetical protein
LYTTLIEHLDDEESNMMPLAHDTPPPPSGVAEHDTRAGGRGFRISFCCSE